MNHTTTLSDSPSPLTCSPLACSPSTQRPRGERRPTRALRSATLAIALAVGALALPAGCTSTPRAPQSDLRGSLDQAMTYAQQAAAAQAKGDFAAAAALNQQALRIRDDLGGVWNDLGVCLIEMEQYMPAREALLRAADLLPTDPRPLENLGLMFTRAGFPQEALTQYVRALERDPNWLPALRGATWAQKELLRSDHAGLERAKLGKFIETDPKWKAIFQSEAMRIEQDLAEANKSEQIRT